MDGETQAPLSIRDADRATKRLPKFFFIVGFGQVGESAFAE